MSGDTRSSKIGNMRRNTVRFYRDVKSELKRVIWPTKEQLVNNTVTVLAACLLIGIVIWTIDAGLGKVAKIVFTR